MIDQQNGDRCRLIPCLYLLILVSASQNASVGTSNGDDVDVPNPRDAWSIQPTLVIFELHVGGSSTPNGCGGQDQHLLDHWVMIHIPTGNIRKGDLQDTSHHSPVMNLSSS